VVPRLSRTPGDVDELGPRHGQHNEEVYVGELGLETGTLDDLRAAGVV
jgi:formyl-CoA transferase